MQLLQGVVFLQARIDYFDTSLRNVSPVTFGMVSLSQQLMEFIATNPLLTLCETVDPARNPPCELDHKPCNYQTTTRSTARAKF